MVADSISPTRRRISSMEVTMPRCVLAEFNTHRMLSRNSASSRAIPIQKMLKSVKENPFMPIRWMKNHPGMQGTEYFGEKETFESSNPMDPNAPGVDGVRQNEEGRWVSPGGCLDIIPHLKEKWLWLRDMAVQEAEMLNNAGVLYYPLEKGVRNTAKLTGDGHGLTKQMCNRLLEPWMWTTVLVTATEWENFFALRMHEAAEIHIQKVAGLMLECLNNSIPKELQPGQWHVPYGDNIRGQEFSDYVSSIVPEDVVAIDIDVLEDIERKIATARCAQVSYTVAGEEGKPMDFAKLVALHDRLLAQGHMSPFEHIARCMSTPEEGKFTSGPAKEHGWCGNFRGWRQYRKMVPMENRSDNRLIKHV